MTAPILPASCLLGSPLDGVLAEYVALHEDGVVMLPPGLSFEEGSTPLCAGVTAWNALMGHGRPVRPGDTVLCQGTGGVSMLALQFARAAGAQVIVISSNDDKLERAKQLGAAAGINYQKHPEWHKEVDRITNGRGVDQYHADWRRGDSGSFVRHFVFECAPDWFPGRQRRFQSLPAHDERRQPVRHRSGEYEII